MTKHFLRMLRKVLLWLHFPFHTWWGHRIHFVPFRSITALEEWAEEHGRYNWCCDEFCDKGTYRCKDDCIVKEE